jgi:hypothetical protein
MYSTRDLLAAYVDAVAVGFHDGCEQQVPPLRIAIDEANRNAPVGMTDFVFWDDNSYPMLRLG